jgi:hypothetical protein
VCTEYVVLLDAETFEKKYYIPLYRGNAVTQGICCLGPCWFAFQSPHALGDRVDSPSAVSGVCTCLIFPLCSFSFIYFHFHFHFPPFFTSYSFFFSIFFLTFFLTFLLPLC